MPPKVTGGSEVPLDLEASPASHNSLNVPTSSLVADISVRWVQLSFLDLQ